MNNEISYLPDEIGKLESLTDLYLFNNQLVTLPPTIGNLKQLKILDLGKNNPLKNLPQELFSLKHLDKFMINRCPNLDIKVIKFPKVLSECFFNKTNLLCYQPGTCQTIKMDNNSKNITISESEFLKNTKACTEEDINSVKQGIIDSSSSKSSSSDTSNSGSNETDLNNPVSHITEAKVLISASIIMKVVFIMITVAIIVFIFYFYRKINKKIDDNLYKKIFQTLLFMKNIYQQIHHQLHLDHP